MSKVQGAPEAEVGEGRYVYCIVGSGAELDLGEIGVDDSRVYAVPYKDVAAIVHACEAEPYETKNDEKAKEWVLAHEYVIDQATKRFGTVLPFSFDAIVRGGDDALKDVLTKGYDKFRKELERLKDKSEYTVRIYCDEQKLAEEAIKDNGELGKLKEKMEKMPKGAQYLFRRKFELKVKDTIASRIMALANGFSSQVRSQVDEIKAEEGSKQVPEKYKGKKMIVGLACLVHKDKVDVLGEVLGGINGRDGYAVQFTGPWAPFSFTRLKEV